MNLANEFIIYRGNLLFIGLIVGMLSGVSPAWAEPEEENARPEESGEPEEQNARPTESEESANEFAIPVESQTTETTAVIPAGADVSIQRSLVLFGSLDMVFSAGNALIEGYSIPSLRLGAKGNLLREVNYRLSMGQTREVSSAFLPQLLPVDAYVNASLLERNTLQARFGMFRPELDPNWTMDLSETVFPDYSLVHRLLLLGNDIGFEVKLSPGPWLNLTAGYLNGNGVFSLNTNNSRAVTGSLQCLISTDLMDVTVGVGGYRVGQSTSNSVNYKLNVLGNAFLGLLVKPIQTTLDVALVAGRIADPNRTLDPVGMTVSARTVVVGGAGLFGRYENLRNAPSSGGTLTHFQAGSFLEVSQGFTGFLFYEHLINPSGDAETSGQFRLRMQI